MELVIKMQGPCVLILAVGHREIMEPAYGKMLMRVRSSPAPTIVTSLAISAGGVVVARGSVALSTQ